MAATAKTVLVCGGAGYIGSHMVRLLAEHGYVPCVLDDFSTGHARAVEGFPVFRASLLDPAALTAALAARPVHAVMHFAGKIQVGESVVNPAPYYENNVTGTLNLLAAMRWAGVSRFVFSSSAAVYGLPDKESLDEDQPLRPVNPYGQTKRQAEDILRDYAAAYGMSCVSLRYFNAAGAHPDGTLGESHSPETHLIPNILLAVLGKAPRLRVFGDDYPTPDGTCVRDYIHVQDLASAHLLALDALDDPVNRGRSLAYNLGNGKGFSVREVIRAAETVTGKIVPCDTAPRRAGDPPYLVADSSRARAELGWKPACADISTILETSWRWHQAPRF